MEIEENHPLPTDDVDLTHETESVKSSDPHQGVSFFKLVQIFENLVLLGLCSIEKWNIVISGLKEHADVVSNAEILNLYFVLTQISHYLSSKIFETSDLSQHKVPLIEANEHTYKELLTIVNPILKKKPLKDKSFSYDCVNKLLSIVRCILEKGKKQEEVVETVAKNLKKRKHASFKQSSKTSKRHHPSSSEHESSSEDESETDEKCDTDRYEQLFKSKSSIKDNTPVIIKQVFQTQKHKLRRRFTTPGESGRYMIKIEVTDCKDLKKCHSFKTYWTKVSKKAVFLANSADDPLYQQADDLLFKAGELISKTKGREMDVSKISESNFSKSFN